MLKGYKTFLCAALAVLAGVLGKHVAPETLAIYADVIIAGLGVTFAALRVATTTPVFQTVAQDIGLSPALLDQIKNTVVSLDPDDKQALGSFVADLNGAVDRLTGHPLFQPATVDAMTTLASLLPGLAGGIGGIGGGGAPISNRPPVAQQTQSATDLAAQAGAQQQ